MKNNFYTKILLLFVTLTCSWHAGHSQVVYRSILTGNWGSNTTWERSDDGGTVWAPATAGQTPTINNSVIVQSGNVVTLEASGKNCLNLTIQQNAQVTAQGSAFSLRVGSGASGTAGVFGTLQNDGILGGAGDMLVLELPQSATAVSVTGTGTFEIGRIRALTGNLNFPGSVAAGAGPDTKLVIDHDIRLNIAGNYAYSIVNTSQNVNDVMSFIINAGKTVTVASPTSFFHNDAVTGGVVSSTGGKYAYTIDGTLDLSANPSSSGGTSLVPFGNAGSSLSLDVNGVLKLGAYFRADAVSNSVGQLALNINDGGLVDASLTTTLLTGSIGTGSGNIFFVTDGSGAMKRSATGDGTKIKYPIGTATDSYTPAYIENTGTTDNFTVNVKGSFDNSPPALTLQKQWTITEETPGSSNCAVSFSWTTADESDGFTGANPVYITRWDGSKWVFTAASVTGSGSAADPYVARAGGFSSFSPFSVTNSSTIPVNFSYVNVASLNNGAKLVWNIQNELNAKYYTVERSTDGRNFTSIGSLNAGNVHTYTWTDKDALSGTIYYRIKATAVNGSYIYSSIVALHNEKAIVPYIVAAPNPVKGGRLNLQLNGLGNGTYAISIYSSAGQRLLTKTIRHEGGNSTQLISLPAAVRNGIYTVQVTNGEAVYTSGILVE